jgi:Ca2+-binding EF-hand superfamily protein
MAKAGNPGDPAWKPVPEAAFQEKRSGLDPSKPKPPPVVVYDEFGQPIDVVDAADDAEARRKAMLRAHEMARKGEKKRLCEDMVSRLDLRLPELQRCFKRFRDLDCFRAGGLATFDEMCTVLDIETDNDFRDIYTVFADPSAGKVNVRELLLALNNFTGCTKPQRVNFCFFLFDQDQSGEISTEELMMILQASHLSADVDAVRKKAASILTSADHDGSGTVSLEEFIVIANRFPNILFPSYSMTDEDAAKGKTLAGAPTGPGSKFPGKKKKKAATDTGRSDTGAL